MTKENPQENLENVRLNENFDFEVEDSEIDQLIESLEVVKKAIKDPVNVGRVYSMEKITEGILKTLKEARDERRLLLEQFDLNPDGQLQDSKGEILKIDKQKESIDKIDSILAEYYPEKDKGSEIVSEITQEQIDSLGLAGFTLSDLHRKLGGKSDFDNEVGAKESEESQIFEKKNEKIESLSNYDHVVLSIIENKDSQARTDFLENNKNIVEDLLGEVEKQKKIEKPSDVDNFISKHQENINDLITLIQQNGSEQGGLLISTLKNNLDLLNTLKSTYKPVSSDIVPKKVEIETTIPVKETVGRERPKQLSVHSTREDDYDFLERQRAIHYRGKKPLPKKVEKVPETAPEAEPATPEKETPVEGPKSPDTSPDTETPIFSMEEGEDYSEIGEDKEFDKWITSIDKSLRNEGVNIVYEVKDVKDWYREYQEYIPYREKLDKVFEEARKNNKDINKLVAGQEKLDDLLYKIHKEGDIAKSRIDTIYESYTKLLENKDKVAKLQKTKELKDVIEKAMTKGGTRELTTEEVKNTLESRGEENTTENIDGLRTFLEDMQNNYDFYNKSTKNEEGSNTTRYAFEKYAGAKTLLKEESKSKKLSWGRKIWGRVVASWPKNPDQDGLNQFSSMINIVRKLDLVDRKSGGKDKVRENKERMRDLIEFSHDKIDILTQYLTNPKDVDISTLTPENKKQLESFESLFKTYTNSKYRTSDAKNKAQTILENSDLDSDIDVSEMDLDMLYANGTEMEMFETNARLQLNKEALTKLDAEIGKIISVKTKKDKAELDKLEVRFNSIKAVLEVDGGSADRDLLKTISLKLNVLVLRNIDKDNLKDLSNSLPTYENILLSDESKEIKTAYVKELIENLQKHRANKNTMVQNSTLDVIIKKYQDKLKSIK